MEEGLQTAPFDGSVLWPFIDDVSWYLEVKCAMESVF